MRSFGSKKKDFIPIYGMLYYINDGISNELKYFGKDFLNEIQCIGYNWLTIMTVSAPIIVALYERGYIGP